MTFHAAEIRSNFLAMEINIINSGLFLLLLGMRLQVVWLYSGNEASGGLAIAWE